MNRTRIENKNLIFVLCGPSGAGKTSIKICLLIRRNDLELVPSVTTRPKINSDVSIAEYHHITNAKYKELHENDELISKRIQQFGFYYGIRISEIADVLNKGQDALLEETTLWGIEQLKRYFNNVISVFVSPPSLEELKRRLQKRKRETEENITLRLDLAKQILSSFRINMTNYHLVNEELQMSVDFFNNIITQEKLKASLQ